uniref:ATPase inhibitor B, mitochondrial n=1 Tax=Pristiophorus japonicus TaxID=55135 RepID=UPI00398F57B3
MLRSLLRAHSLAARLVRGLSDSGQLGELGKGAGKGGGGGGSIREAGGAFGARQAALEEKYFREKERDQIAKLKQHHQEEIHHHEEEIQRLQDAVRRHKSQIKKLRKQDDDDD